MPAPKTEAEAEQERHERAEKAELDRRLVDLTAELATFTRYLAYSTIALFIATAGLAFFAFVQSRDMKESLRIGKEASEAARIGADAASRGAEHARDALVTTQRAFVSIESFVQNPVLDRATGISTGWKIIPKWHNRGLTPARNCRHRLSVKGFDGGVPQDFSFADQTDEPSLASFVLGPGDSIRGAEAEVTSAGLLMLEKSPTSEILIWCTMTYNDVFEGTPERRTTVCARFRVVSNPHTPGDRLPIDFQTYGSYNDAT